MLNAIYQIISECMGSLAHLPPKDLLVFHSNGNENLYSAFFIDIFKCALQARDLWVRSDISIYSTGFLLSFCTRGKKPKIAGNFVTCPCTG